MIAYNHAQQAIINMQQIILKEGALLSWSNSICPHCGNQTNIDFSFGHIYWCSSCHAQWSSIAVRPGMHMIFGEQHESLNPCEGGVKVALEQFAL